MKLESRCSSPMFFGTSGTKKAGRQEAESRSRKEIIRAIGENPGIKISEPSVSSVALILPGTIDASGGVV
ncbi:MAG: hypothetical protein GY869_27315 [Planctomycetes bacterium]|nr:hypothetical protein [Planctomycetota bacterium]